MVKKKIKNIDFNRIGLNITALMDASGIDATELSQQTGLPCSTISRLRSQTGDFSPNLSSLMPIADFFCITLSQLIGEEPIDTKEYGTYQPQKMRKLPIPILQAETILDYLNNHEINDEVVLHVDFPLGQNAFAFLLRGNAMEPQFPDKTLLIVDPALTPENLDHILLLPSGKKIPLFRQLLIEGEEKYIRTLNPAFNEFTKLADDNAKILGVMVQARMNFKDLGATSLQANNNKLRRIG